jgi:ubiquinone/menaquinone biosynthesis C-methylase UbiE
MPNPALIPVFLRELVVGRTLPREPEPDLVMDDPEQVAAYVEAGRIDGVMAAAYLFHTARVSQVIHGCGSVLDLGCGPATQLAQIAELNPGIRFTGLDLSPTMLADAEKHVQALGLGNVAFREGDITTLGGIADGSMDAVISTMALHHLPTMQRLEDCFASIRRVLKPGGALYLTDFGRLKSLKSVIFFAYMNARHQPHIFSLDYERSLRAAFLKEEFETLAARSLPQDAQLVSTFKVPFLVTIKTQDRPLPEELRARLKAMRRALKPRYRRDLDDLRTFFRLGGLGNDPFA